MTNRLNSNRNHLVDQEHPKPREEIKESKQNLVNISKKNDVIRKLTLKGIRDIFLVAFRGDRNNF